MSTRESTSIKPSSQNPNDAPDQASPTRRPQLDSWLCATAQNMNADRSFAQQNTERRRGRLNSWLCAIAQNMNADRSFAQQNTERRRGQLGVPIFIPGSGDDVKYDTRHG